MPVFAGKFNATIDDKGRVVLPSTFKKAMGDLALEYLIVEKNYVRKCLDIHPEQSWSKRVKKFESKYNSFNPSDDAVRQFFYESFIQINIAPNGRINIPNEYLEFASLEKSVKFIGMHSSIRLMVGGAKEEIVMTPEAYLAAMEAKNKTGKKKKKK